MARVTVEDSLKVVPSRFSLVHVASQRGRQLLKGAHPLVESNNRSIVTALREIAAAKVTMLDPDDVSAVEEAKAEEAKAKEVKAKEAKAEEAKAEESKADDAKAKEVKAKDVKTKDVKAKDVKAKDVKAKDVKAKKVVAEK